MKKKHNLSVLLLARYDDFYSSLYYEFLKKNFLTVHVIWSKKIGEKIKISKIRKKNYDYIFSYRSYFILSEKILNKAKIAAINFHPSTPSYRGFGCANFAILDNAKFFGSTVHFMDKKIDSGKIISVQTIKILRNENLNSLLLRNYKSMFSHSKKITRKLIDGKIENLDEIIKKNRKEKWSSKIYRKKDLDKLFKIKIGNKMYSKKVFSRLVNGLSYNKFQPYIELHGFIFEYKGH